MINTIKLYCQSLLRKWKGKKYTSSDYWKERYLKGGNSGAGSYGQLAAFKAEVINKLIEDYQIQSVIEFGSGDGNQLKYYQMPRYLGFDVSDEAVRMCKNMFANDSSKTFKNMNAFNHEKAELTLSIDVIYHLVEDPIFVAYMNTLFQSSTKMVLIYSSNFDDIPGVSKSWHHRNRNFTDWVIKNQPNFKLRSHIPNRFPHNNDELNSSVADFYLYERILENS
jgi:protein O-GlcNAc transferase